MKAEPLRRVYRMLLDAFGEQDWWPAQSAFEVMIGAILTQNTAWTNVERALERLQTRIPLDAESILALDPSELADALRPSGYFNVKSQRVRGFCEEYLRAGGHRGLDALTTPELRARLLAIKGIGPETADDILLYAFDRPVFVVDAYTRRIFERLGLLAGGETYEVIRRAFEQALGPDVPMLKEYHALIVSQGKEVCRTRPACDRCALRRTCAAAAPSPSDSSTSSRRSHRRRRGSTASEETQ
ncbi:endonuclease III domain-containing protein [Thiocapsa bogorovii]|uniref:endonuclease III domain-containing protein n=1 Tax=Thiocapsa bogorovii TaxID=521689 RepID=UPI001E5D3AF5|nr:endonuclease III domain-containing protein [Thiocapsa bogorovii]UHD15823.1 endonuclease III domain-containing protein [Thiocapsa bogorovii]